MSAIKKAGIVVDNYKVPVFKRVFDEVGFKYTDNDIGHDNTIMAVEFTDETKEKLLETVKWAETEARK